MNQAELLDITKNFFEEMRIHTHLIDAPYDWRDEYDLGLRHTLLKESFQTASTFFQPESNFHAKKQVYFITDLFSCHYLCIPIPEGGEKRILLVGPFSTEEFTLGFVRSLSERLQIPSVHFDYLTQYYTALPILRDKNCIRSIIICICSRLYGNSYQILIQSCKDQLSLQYEPISPAAANQEFIKNIELRYQNEQKIMDSISHGDYVNAKKYFAEEDCTAVPQRLTDTLRDKKNYLIIFNTLCRKSAQYGGVHPFYLDELSSRFAAQLENTHNIARLNALAGEMIYKYSLLVQNHSPKNYSPMVQKTLDYICLNIQNPLSLNHLAQFLSVNKCYLSSLFKRETGLTIVEFITERRISHAIYLLNTTDDPIQEIAIACGIPDLSYFTKLFRQNKGMTPSQYRKMIKNDI